MKLFRKRKKKKALQQESQREFIKLLKRKDFRKIQKSEEVQFSNIFDFCRLKELAKELYAFKWAISGQSRALSQGEEIACKEIDSVIKTIELIVSDDTNYGYFNTLDVDMDLWLDSYCLRIRNRKTD